MPEITPCLWFDTEGEEAAKFYTSVFPNSRTRTWLRYGLLGRGSKDGHDRELRAGRAQVRSPERRA